MIPFVKTFYENNKSSKIYDALNENKYSLQFMIDNCPKKIMWPAHLYNTKCTNTIINNYDKIKDGLNMLSPEYLYPEGWSLPFEPKILLRDKHKYGGHGLLRGIAGAPLSDIKTILKRLLTKWL